MNYKNLVYQKLNNDYNKITKMNRYVELVLEANKLVNLTGFDKTNIWKDGIYESLIYLENSFSNLENKDLVDIGAGAGFPSIPFLIMKQNCFNLTIIESLTKRINFLLKVKNELDLNLNLINQRAELFKNKKFDYVCARAVAPLNILLEISSHLGKVGSYYAFIKSNLLAQEIKDSKEIIKNLKIDYKLVNLDSIINKKNIIFTYCKKSENPYYPRKWTIIKSDAKKAAKHTKNS